ncbi:MAG: hypothetical protein AB2827_12360 [Candidatus Thiodiazotropha sp.]
MSPVFPETNLFIALLAPIPPNTQRARDWVRKEEERSGGVDFYVSCASFAQIALRSGREGNLSNWVKKMRDWSAEYGRPVEWTSDINEIWGEMQGNPAMAQYEKEIDLLELAVYATAIHWGFKLAVFEDKPWLTLLQKEHQLDYFVLD